MTTIIDPTGTPVVIFNKGGVAIVSLACPQNPTAPTTIDAIAGHVIVLATQAGAGNDPSGFQLSPDFEIGDCVEFYNVNYTQLHAFNINDATSAVVVNKGVGSGALLRKVADGTAHDWAFVGQ